MVKEYKKRVADQMLADKLEATGAVLVEGPKYCGKTTLSKQQAKSILSMADPDTLSQNLALARTNISRLLKGETPRLIDEWQIAPQFWDAVSNDIKRVDDVERDEELTKRIMRSYARNQASQATAGTIMADIKHKSISGTVHMG